jgi:hypothetical protein
MTLWPWGTMTSGMITLSGTSVVTSSNTPPVGAGEGRLKVRVWRWPVVMAKKVGLTWAPEGSTLKVPIVVVPPPPPRVVPVCLERRDKEGDGIRRFVDGAGGIALHVDHVLLREAPADDADPGADWPAIGNHREHIAAHDARALKLGERLALRPPSADLNGVLDDVVIGQLRAARGQLVLDLKNAVADRARRHWEVATVDHDAGID